jgi:hypothetical protein
MRSRTRARIHNDYVTTLMTYTREANPMTCIARIHLPSVTYRQYRLFLFELCLSPTQGSVCARLTQNGILPSAAFRIPLPAPSHCSSDVRPSRRGSRILGDTGTYSCPAETPSRESVHTEKERETP